MARASKLFPSFKDKKDSFVIRLVERVSGKTLTGFKLNLAHAIGNGVLIGFFLSLLEAMLLLWRFGLSHLSGIAANAVFTFSVCFSFVFLVALLVNLAGEWKESLTAQHKHYETFISFLFHLITLPLICLVFWLLFSSFPFTRYDDKIRTQELLSICEECSQKAFNPANISNGSGDAPVGANDNQKNKLIKDDLEHIGFKNMTAKELDELLERYNFRDFNTETRLSQITKTFGSISLFPDNKNTDWEKFLIELDHVVSEEGAAYAAIEILTGIHNKAPFNVIVDILNRGHQLNGTHISSLATYLSVEEFRLLDNYGVDLSQTTSIGSNALIASLSNSKGPAVFEYLLTKDSLLFSEDFDVVKEVLVRSIELNRPMNYTQMLIDRGAVVTEETKEWIEHDLRKNNPQYYSLIKSRLSYN